MAYHSLFCVGTKKTVEGTLASILAQLGGVLLITIIGMIFMMTPYQHTLAYIVPTVQVFMLMTPYLITSGGDYTLP